ncbi:hypothetical protein PTKU64_92050 (plasmid) [Paraburkholderia terrae]|uniref:Uncharacterized protein n=1 Tax=Paraburkholderia terrae TaxID=311230 RepID=A0ABM7U2N9_9BURK|nr:hypothetical protein PTKU64_92050 [Paraburkholderia terrae]
MFCPSFDVRRLRERAYPWHTYRVPDASNASARHTHVYTLCPQRASSTSLTGPHSDAAFS